LTIAVAMCQELASPGTLPQPCGAELLSASPARCLRCSADLSSLPEWARYCPRCGLDTHASPPAALRALAADPLRDIGDMIGQWRHLYELSVPMTQPPAPPAGAPVASASQILTGYANAMYNLGRRYDAACGAAGNPREAVRCYFKSARLGNLRALIRLAARWIDCHDAPR